MENKDNQTRKEITNFRDLQFSSWVRQNLPCSFETGFRATDLDFVLYDVRKKQVMLIEVKTRNAKVKEQQRLIFNFIDFCIKKCLSNFDLKGTIFEGWTYCGFHLVTFSNTNFKDGIVKFDNEYITENDLKQVLSLGENSGCCPKIA